jgi:hypothetical protein
VHSTFEKIYNCFFRGNQNGILFVTKSQGYCGKIQLLEMAQESLDEILDEIKHFALQKVENIEMDGNFENFLLDLGETTTVLSNFQKLNTVGTMIFKILEMLVPRQNYLD